MRFKLIVLALCLFIVPAAFAQQTETANSTAGSTAAATKAAVPPNAITLPEKDQKLLEALSARIAQMAGEIKDAEESAKQAETALNRANTFISQYNQMLANREALVNKVAADIAGVKTSEVELSPDGKYILRKPKAPPAAPAKP